jgi:hypothetical protein
VPPSKGVGPARSLEPVAPNDQLSKYFREVVVAVTPFARDPDWDEIGLLPLRAALHPRWAELIESIDRDPLMRRFFEDFTLSSGTGADAGWDAEAIACELVTKPWQRIELGDRDRTAQSLAEAANQVLDDARDLASGRTVKRARAHHVRRTADV